VLEKDGDEKMSGYPYKDPDMIKVVELLNGQNIADISRRSGVSTSTMYHWRNKTRRPQHLTMQFALRAMGYDFKIVKF